MIVALVVGAGVVGAGGILCAAGVTRVGFLVQAAGAVVIAVGGFWILAANSSGGDSFAGVLAPRLGVDPLSGFFLGTLGATAAPALLFASRYTRGRAIGALVAAFTLTLAWVLCARDPVTFLAAWELMTLIPAAIILVNRSDRAAAQRAVFVYVSITHLGGAGTWVAVLLASAAGALDCPGAVVQGSGLQAAIALAVENTPSIGIRNGSSFGRSGCGIFGHGLHQLQDRLPCRSSGLALERHQRRAA